MPIPFTDFKLILKTLQTSEELLNEWKKNSINLTGENIDVPQATPEDIKKRWQEYTEQLYKKELHDLDKHNGVISHLEPDILECEVMWALGSITSNKASGGDGIPVELFRILKDKVVKVLHSICQ